MLPISFDKLPFKGLSELLTSLDKAAVIAHVDFFLIGAVARDIWMHARHEVREWRMTADVDVAVMVADVAHYRALTKAMVTNGNFRAIEGYEYTFLTPFGVQVDILPFGGSLEVEGKVRERDASGSEIWVNGFREVYELGVEDVAFENGRTYKVATLPAIVILKFRAYDDAPELRVKDIVDIGYILKHYEVIVEAEIFEDHLDLVVDGYDGGLAAARVLGRQIQRIVGRDSAIARRLEGILNRSIGDPADSPIGDLLAQNGFKSVENAIRYLDAIHTGLIE